MTSYNLQSAFVIRQTNTEILVRQTLRLVGIYDGGVQNHSWEGSSKNNSRSPERRIRNSDQSGVDRSDLPVDLLGLTPTDQTPTIEPKSSSSHWN
ncbi:unnamed protein product [Aspergillus oryzae]|nr:unnamed protein product [Aspergillus oryzae]